MKRIRSYNQFRESRPIKEEFLGKMWRNITGKNKERIEKVTKSIEQFKDLITPPKISDIPYFTLRETDDELVKEVLDNFNRYVESGSWKEEMANSLNIYIKEKPEFIKILMDYIKGKPDFSEIEEMDDTQFRIKFSPSSFVNDNIKGRLQLSKGDIAKSILKKSLSGIGEKEEYQRAKKISEPNEPETSLLKYYDDIFSWMDSDKEPKKDFEGIDNDGELGSILIGSLMKSFIAFQGKSYNSVDYEKENPKAFEEALGKDYIDKIDFNKKISEVKNLNLIKEELERWLSYYKQINSDRQSARKSIDKLSKIREVFGEYSSDLLSSIKEYSDVQTNEKESFLNLINYIFDNYGNMSIKEFFDFYNSKTAEYRNERFTTSEDYVEGREVYKIKEGCGKVYHGGKISPTDLDFLFREQGGMYGGKLMTGANNWPTILGKSEAGLLSINITRRVYELSIKPGTKMVDHNPGGSDSGSKGGLKDENGLYTPHGIRGMASKWYMDTPDGQVPDNLPENVTNKEYIDSALQSEVVVFDKSVCDIRIVPYKELISEYERLGGTGHSSYKKLKDDYPKMRNMVWAIESASPGILSNLKEFTQLDNLSEINKFIRRGSQSNEAPNDQKVDDLVEKCGSISVRTSEIQKFPTLLDYIILLSSR
jgi:hypothetical protein